MDKWRYSRQLGVLSITGDVIDNWRYFGQLSVLPTTGDPMKTVVQKPNEFSIPRGGTLQLKIPGAGSIVWGLGFWLKRYFGVLQKY